jgi:hypothetical protein
MTQASFTYIADISHGKQRTLAITLVDLGLGFAIGTSGFVAGYVIEATNYFYPMLLSLSICALVLLLIAFLPETVVPAKKKSLATFWKYVHSTFSFYIKSESDGKRWRYIVGILALALNAIGVMSKMGVETLYELNHPFCWSAVEIGWFGAVRSASQQVGCMALLGGLQRCFQDASVAILGALSAIASLVIEAFATVSTVLYIGE